MTIRDATAADWPAIWPFLHVEIVTAGDTFSYDERMEGGGSDDVDARASERTTVAVDAAGDVLGSANMYPNHDGPAHMSRAATSWSIRDTGAGVGRALAEDMLDWVGRRGFRAIQFNAVAETNSAIALYRALGFEVLATIPEGFRHPRELRGRTS